MKAIRFILLGFVSLGMIICLTGTASAGLDDGLLGFYQFNGNANDESGNGNHATVNGATLVEDRFENANRAYYFDGVDDYIISTDAVPGLQVSDALTISTWIYKENTDQERIAGVHQAAGDSQPEYSILYGHNERIRMQTKDDDNNWGFDHYSDTTIPISEWHHLAFVYTGSTYSFYLDGVVNGSGSMSTLIRDIDPNPYLYIGARGDGDEFFTGAIDDVRIYNRALSESEVQALAVVPEPISSTLFLIGGATLGFRRFQKKIVSRN